MQSLFTGMALDTTDNEMSEEQRDHSTPSRVVNPQRSAQSTWSLVILPRSAGNAANASFPPTSSSCARPVNHKATKPVKRTSRLEQASTLSGMLASSFRDKSNCRSDGGRSEMRAALKALWATLSSSRWVQ
jgi:hypothetical protein